MNIIKSLSKYKILAMATFMSYCNMATIDNADASIKCACVVRQRRQRNMVGACATLRIIACAVAILHLQWQSGHAQSNMHGRRSHRGKGDGGGTAVVHLLFP